MKSKDPLFILNQFLAQKADSKTDQLLFLKTYMQESEIKLQQSYADHSKVYELVLIMQHKLTEMSKFQENPKREQNTSQLIKAIEIMFSQNQSNQFSENSNSIIFEAYFFLLTQQMRSWKSIQRDFSLMDLNKLLQSYFLENLEPLVIETVSLRSNFITVR